MSKLNRLVLAMTATKDLEAIIEQFKNLQIDKFIFTKLDETNLLALCLI